MGKVIGGEFAVDITRYLNNDEKKLIETELLYSTGRCALFAILNDIAVSEKQISKMIYIPDYLCDSITRTIIDAGWQYDYYHIQQNLQADRESLVDKLRRDSKVVLLINYFGLINLSDVVADIRHQSGDTIIIIDNVQAFYEQRRIADIDYEFTSLRKWFPVPDGAGVIKYRFGKMKELKLDMNEFSQYKLIGNIMKNYKEYISEEVILEFLEKGEQLLDQHYLCRSTVVSQEILNAIDFEKIAGRRRKNAAILHEGLDEIGIKHIYTEHAVPLFIPIFIDDQKELRKNFFEKDIFPPVHWKYIDDKISGNNSLYCKELSLICDQRYDEDDMLRQLDILKTSQC